MYDKFKLETFNKSILFISLLSYIYFWDLGKNSFLPFDFRILVFLYLPYLLFDLLKKNIFALLIIFGLLCHYFFVTKLYDQNISYKNIGLIILIYYFLIFSINKKKEIFEILPLVVRFFLLVFFFVTIAHFTNIKFHFHESISSACTIFIDISNFSSLKLFTENSHFGMIAPASFVYFFFTLTKENYKKDLFIFLPIIIFLTVLYISATLLVGIIVSCVALLIIFEKKFKYSYIGIILILFFSLFVLLSKQECLTRITRINFVDYLKLSSEIQKNRDFKNKTESSKILNKISEDETKFDITRNLTVDVYENAIFVAANSVINQYFGYGFNNYINAFEKYTKLNFEISDNHQNKTIQMPRLSSEILVLNKNDGRSNFIKLVTEYGFFSILIFLFFLIYALNKKTNFIPKTFLIPLVLTQLLSGAGYFNGGFILAVCLMISLYRGKKL